MKLTKEEYRDLFDDLERIVEVACESNECISCPLKRKGICIKADVEVGFEQLIEEHFDNPPLNFDEIDEDMWVWDNKRKLYVQVDVDFREENNVIILRHYENSYNSNVERTMFEENRFYLKEVTE